MRRQVSTATLQVAIKIEHAHAHVDPHTLIYARVGDIYGVTEANNSCQYQNSFTCGCFNAATRYKIHLSGNYMTMGVARRGEDTYLCLRSNHLQSLKCVTVIGHVNKASATAHPLPPIKKYTLHSQQKGYS